MVKVDLCTLENALEKSYVSHFMGGKTINVVCNTFVSSLQTVVSAETQMNVSRSLSKMKSVFITLDKGFSGDRAKHAWTFWNNFWNPTSGGDITNVVADRPERFSLLQLVIGSKLFPEYPLKSSAECFYSLRTALGIQANNLHSIDTTGVDYRSHKFIVGIDTEKLVGLSFTGMNTRKNLMTVRLKTDDGFFKADRMRTILLAEQIVELADAGALICD